MRDTLEFRLNGRFRVQTRAGADITPRAAKAQGLLALLMTTPDRERGRGWLQDKLWSDRDQPQGAASLRQALAEIRRAFGDHRDVLKANRSAVALDPARVRIEPAIGEFLEGLDLRDPEFEDWLAMQRAMTAPDPEIPDTGGAGGGGARAPWGKSKRRTILFETSGTADPNLRLAEHMFVDTTARSIGESLPVDLLRVAPALTSRGLLVATVEAFQGHGGALGLRVSLEESETHRLIWSEIQLTPLCGAPDIGDPRVMGLSNRLVEEITGATCNEAPGFHGNADASRLGLLAMEKIFSLRAPDLVEAERLLHIAIGLEPRGLFYGWLAQLYSIQFVERFLDRDAVIEKAQHSCARALELEPLNSNVLATVSNARLTLEKDLAVSGELARMAVDANPANPLARWSLASAQLYYGRATEAHATACRAQHLAAGSRFRFWSDFQKSLTASLTGRALEAIQLAEAAAALRPQYRPPLRYLIALYAGNGMEKKALDTMQRLTRIEPDFELDRMVRDNGYPVSLMRNSGLLQTERLQSLVA